MPRNDPSWEVGVAGGSAQAKFERSTARHRETTRRRRPAILLKAGVLVAVGLAMTGLGSTWPFLGWSLVFLAVASAFVALFILPDGVRSWDTGAEGEVWTADALEPLVDRGFVVLHDRRMPRSRANIDHIVIGPPGVFVVETKNYGGELRVRSGELYVNRRRRTGVIDQVTRQADAVSDVLDGDVVGRVVCVHRANFPWFSKPKLSGVPIVDARGLVRLLEAAPPRLEAAEVVRMGARVAAALPPAYRAPQPALAEPSR